MPLFIMLSNLLVRDCLHNISPFFNWLILIIGYYVILLLHYHWPTDNEDVFVYISAFIHPTMNFLALIVLLTSLYWCLCYCQQTEQTHMPQAVNSRLYNASRGSHWEIYYFFLTLLCKTQKYPQFWQTNIHFIERFSAFIHFCCNFQFYCQSTSERFSGVKLIILYVQNTPYLMN